MSLLRRAFFASVLSRLRALPREEGGQVVPMVCVVMVGLLGISAFGIDAGRAMYTSRELQATTDSAALAGARALPTATTVAQITGSTGVVQQYSSVAGSYNERASLPAVTVTSSVLCLKTLQAQGIPCVGNVPDNAVQVRQTSTVTTFFGGVIGIKTLSLASVATAASRGGSPRPSNIAVIIDTTLSMNAVDTNCVVNGVALTQMQCALNGFQMLLQNINPCGKYQTKCADNNGVNSNPFDQVALFTFPNLVPNTVNADLSCTLPVPNYDTYDAAHNAYITMPPNNAWSGISTATAYSFPTAGAGSYKPNGQTPTYQLTDFLSDYRTSDSATTLNQNSVLVKAAGGVTNCAGIAPSNFDGIYGTYYAGVIYAAQAALTAQQTANPSSENVLILLSDGDSTAPQYNGPYNVMPSPANASGYYPSYQGECGQAVTAAKAATAAGTIVYTVAYGAGPVGCASDALAGQYPGITPCNTMYSMASAPQNFYSDYKQSGSNSICYSSQPITALSDIFAAIAADLSEARLIPNNTT